MGDAGPVVGVDGQAGDQAFGDIAGGDIHNIQGLALPDVLRLLAEIRAITADTEHRGRMQDTEAELHRVMTRQRLDVIAGDARASRIWLVALTIAVALVALILIGLLYDRLALSAGIGLGVLYVMLRGR